MQQQKKKKKKASVSRTVGLQDSQNLVAGNALNLGNAVRVTEDDTDLRGSQTLASKLANLILELLRRGLEPRGRSATVGQRRARNTLAGDQTNQIQTKRKDVKGESNGKTLYPGVCMRPMLRGCVYEDGRRELRYGSRGPQEKESQRPPKSACTPK